MKKIVLVLMFIPTFFFSQEKLMKVDYEMKISASSLPPNLSDVDKEKILKQIEKPVLYSLYLQNGDSYYTNLDETKLFLGSTKSVKNNTNYTTTVSYNGAKPVKIYKNKNEDFLYSFENIADQGIYKKYLKTYVKVEYKDETTKIDEFECKLVEVTDKFGNLRKIWYTEQIPIASGPLDFVNFPGLVLKVEAKQMQLYATKISRNVENETMPKLDSKIELYEEKSFEEKVMEIKQAREQKMSDYLKEKRR